MFDKVAALYDETGRVVGRLYEGLSYVSLNKRFYRLDETVCVEDCEQVDGDRCKCSRCETVINFKEDDFCRGCGAEVYA